MDGSKLQVDSSYLRAAGALLAPLKQRTFALMEIAPGHRLLDVGCGPGIDTVALAQLVGDAGSVMGVDFDPAMLVEADRSAAQAGVSGRIEHMRADATSLPFDDASFDSCRSERLFQHLSRPAAALAEMARVTRPGGRIVVLDTDWGTLSTATGQLDIERRLVRVRAERLHANGYSGRYLYGQFRRQGLGDITVEAYAVQTTDYAVARRMASMDQTEQEALEAGIVSREELDIWRNGLEQASSESTFFASVGLVLVAGRKARAGAKQKART